MRAIKIDVIKKDVYEIDMENSLDAIYEQLESDDFDIACQMQCGDVLMVDGIGLLRDNPIGAFAFALYHRPLSGHGLIQGCNFAGETIPANSRVDWIKSLVKFVPVELLRGIPTQPFIIGLSDEEFAQYQRTGELPLGKRPTNPQ